MYDEVTMQIVNSAANLLCERGRLLRVQPFLQLKFGLIKIFEKILISGVLRNHVDMLVVPEKTVKFGHVGMICE